MIYIVVPKEDMVDIIPGHVDQSQYALEFMARIFGNTAFRKFAAKELGENVDDFNNEIIAEKLYTKKNLSVLQWKKFHNDQIRKNPRT